MIDAFNSPQEPPQNVPGNIKLLDAAFNFDANYLAVITHDKNFRTKLIYSPLPFIDTTASLPDSINFTSIACLRGTTICYLGSEDKKVYEVDLIAINNPYHDPDSMTVYSTNSEFERIQISDISRNFLFAISRDFIMVKDMKSATSTLGSSTSFSGNINRPHLITSLQYLPYVVASQFGTNYIECFKVD